MPSAATQNDWYVIGMLFGLVIAGLVVFFTVKGLFLFIRDVFAELRLIKQLPSKKAVRSRLRQLRLKVQSNPDFEALRKGQAGLVLSGGGAKGAYEIGALRALGKFGIRDFAAVAGTSVGALNGELIAQGSLLDAKRIWHGISPDKVLKPRRFILFIVALLARVVLVPLFALRKFPSIWEEASRHAQASNSILTDKYPDKFFDYYIPKAVKVVAGAVFIAFICIIGGFIIGLEKVFQAGFIRNVVTQLYGPAIAFGSMAVVYIELNIFHDWISEKLSVFSNRPLRELVSRYCSPARLFKRAIPAFVTHATLGEVVKKNEKFGQKGKLDDFFGPYTVDIQYVPIYHDLLKHRPEEVLDYMMQSAALPEIFPKRVFFGHSVIDGGTADNEPFLPVLLQQDIKSLIVVDLNKGEEAIDKRLQNEEIRLKDMAVRIERTENKDELINQTCDQLQKRDVEDLPSIRKILAIEPSLQIGGLVVGTMNFLNYKARILMWLGYWDALNTLERGMIEFKWWKPAHEMDLGKGCPRCAQKGQGK
jgi:predicted acylesterase/phospholipase RssA